MAIELRVVQFCLSEIILVISDQIALQSVQLPLYAVFTSAAILELMIVMSEEREKEICRLTRTHPQACH